MPTTPNKRDTDIRIASEVSELVGTERDFFVLTGSYSVDALTGADVKHNDIDANVFTTDIPTALGRTATLLHTYASEAELTKQTDDRLEYQYPHQYGLTQVEIQFVRYESFLKDSNGTNFALPSNGSHEVVVPTIQLALRESNQHEHIFSVKSLPFAIGTWALRISGVALDSKRLVRESDIKHFAFLAAIPHDRVAILSAIQHHPQMPDDYDAADALDASYEILERKQGL